MADKETSASGFVAGLLVGLAVGAGIALLYAPESGDKTRKLIGKKAHKVWDESVDRFEEARERAVDYIDQGKKQASEYLDSAKKKLA
jgi:gas vesicle protein